MSTQTHQLTINPQTLNLIPPFTGEKDDLEINDFLKRLETIGNYNKWSETDKKFALIIKCQGAAHKVLTLNEEETYENLCIALRERFQEETTPATNLKKINSLTFRNDQNVLILFDELESYVSKIFADADDSTKDSLLISYATDKLPLHIKRNVIARNPPTYEEFKKITLLEIKAYAAVSPPKSEVLANTVATTQIVDNSSLQADIKQLQAALNELLLREEGRRQRNERTQTCYFCNRPGHYRNQCRDLQRFESDRKSGNYVRTNHDYNNSQFKNREQNLRFNTTTRNDKRYSNINYHRQDTSEKKYPCLGDRYDTPDYQHRQLTYPKRKHEDDKIGKLPTPPTQKIAKNLTKSDVSSLENEQNTEPIITYPDSVQVLDNSKVALQKQHLGAIINKHEDNNKTSSPTPLLTIRMNGQDIKMLIDTGATISLLDEKILKYLNLEVERNKAEINVSLMNGVTTNLNENILLSFYINDKVYQNTFYISPRPVSSSGTYCGILGSNFLMKYNFLIDCKNSQILEVENVIRLDVKGKQQTLHALAGSSNIMINKDKKDKNKDYKNVEQSRQIHEHEKCRILQDENTKLKNENKLLTSKILEYEKENELSTSKINKHEEEIKELQNND